MILVERDRMKRKNKEDDWETNKRSEYQKTQTHLLESSKEKKNNRHTFTEIIHVFSFS